MEALAAHIHAGLYFETSWQLFRLGHFKGYTDEEAVKALAGWCRRQRLEMSFATQRVRDVDVLMLIVKSAPAR